MNDLQIIKKTIQEIVGENLSRIILFGSRARGDNRPDSDYDLLIELRTEIDRARYVELYTSVVSNLALKRIFVDLLFRSKSSLDQFQNVKGTVLYKAVKEGIPI